MSVVWLYRLAVVKAATKHLLMCWLCKCREWICSHRGLEKVGREEATQGSGSNSWEPHSTEAKRGNSHLHSSNSVCFDFVCIMYHTPSLTHPVPSPHTDPYPYTPWVTVTITVPLTAKLILVSRAVENQPKIINHLSLCDLKICCKWLKLIIAFQWYGVVLDVRALKL